MVAMNDVRLSHTWKGSNGEYETHTRTHTQQQRQQREHQQQQMLLYFELHENPNVGLELLGCYVRASLNGRFNIAAALMNYLHGC